MRIHRLQIVQRLPIPIEEAWEFFSTPKNLRQITPPWLDFRITSEAPETMHPGTLLSYQIRPIPGISVNWITEITHLRRPHFFVDEQRFGPFKLWHHEHYFRPYQGGVEMEDIVQYGLYLGPVGSLVHDLYVRKRLHEIFTFRGQTLEQRFGKFDSETKHEHRQQHLHPQQKGPITLKDIYGE